MKRHTRIAAIMLSLLMIVSGLSGCAKEKETNTSGTYTNSEVSSDLPVAEAVKSYLDSVDTEYGYNLSYKLAYDEEYWDNSLGWRSAGSDAEHKCADFLEEEMKNIGLDDVHKVEINCDKFQLNETSFAIDGTEIATTPAAYQCSGTDGDLKAEIVNCGNGTYWDYEEVDVEGKIALVAVDQKNESWIDNYILQAHEKGAIALVTYTIDGYGRAGDDTINVQDICCKDLIPTAAISYNEAQKVLEAIEKGNNQATLNIDADFEIGGGTSYNIVGKIKGKSSDQRIILAGHYDKYWYGFQDDSAAVGLVYTIAKAMVDSGYQPENDIIFIAHGAEEWGVSDSVYDWTKGAWEMIEKQEDWQGSTLALINCELPAYKVAGNTLSVANVPEFRTLTSKLINESGLVVTAGEVALNREPVDTTTMEDGVSYRWHGVPYFLNAFDDEEWIYANYHTDADNADTYDEPTFRTNINWYGAFAQYIDSTPALEIDFGQTAADLEAGIDDNYDAEAGTDVKAYKEKVAAFSAAAKETNDKIAEINDSYLEAVKKGDQTAMAELRAQGAELNKKNLAVFQDVQNSFCKLDDFAVYYGHPNMTRNIGLIDQTVECLNNGVLWGENEDGALDYAYQINGAHDYNYVLFSKEVADEGNAMYDPEKMNKEKSLFGADRMVDVLYTDGVLFDLNALEDLEGVDVTPYIEKYKEARSTALESIKKYADQELKDMARITESLK